MIITVSGVHELELPAERGTAHLVVRHEGSDAPATMAQTQQLATEVVAEVESLRAGGAVTWHAVEAVRTSAWQPFDDHGNPLPTRHAAELPIRVRFADFTELAGFVARWGEDSGVQLGHVEWSLTHQTRTSREDEVLAAALSDARHRAEVLARAAGGSGVQLLEVADPGLLGQGGQPVAAMGFSQGAMMRSAKSEAAPVGVAPEAITVRAEVQARFQTD